MPETLTAIAKADVITLGPGSLFTSVIPNLLVEGISAAIRRSPAMKAYFVNLMWQPGETVNFTRVGPHPRHPQARPAASCSTTPSLILRPLQLAAEALRKGSRRCRWRTTSSRSTKWESK